jgi:hypothetical protein
MSSYDIPSARHARMKDAVQRVPLIVDFPPSRSGFETRNWYPRIGVSSVGSTSESDDTGAADDARVRAEVGRFELREG